MTRTTRMTALAVAATVAGGLLVTTAAVPAGADIVLGSSIAEVTIGQRPAEVRELKGKPRKVTKRRDSDLGENLKVWQYGKNGRRLDITFYRREVVEVRTQSRKQRVYPYDIGAGSTKAEIQAKLRADLQCFDRSKSVEECWTAFTDPGERSSWFRLRDGVVYMTAVMVGLY